MTTTRIHKFSPSFWMATTGPVSVTYVLFAAPSWATQLDAR